MVDIPGIRIESRIALDRYFSAATWPDSPTFRNTYEIGLRRRHPDRDHTRHRPRPRHRPMTKRATTAMQLFDHIDHFGAFDDAVTGDVRDPYTELARLRREQPVQRLDFSAMPHQESKPVFLVYRFDDIQQVLRDNTTFSSSIVKDFFGEGKHVMVGMDEPEHGRHRALVAKAFSPKALATWEAKLVHPCRRGPDRSVRRPRARRTGQRIHLPLPQPGHRRAAGTAASRTTPSSNAGRSRCSRSASTGSAPSAASQALGDYLLPILAARRQDPRDDLTSGLAHTEIDGEKLSDDEISCPSCTSCCPPESKPPTALSATCCSACCPTPTNSPRCAPTAP